jgi:hypothetical protein
MPTIEELRTLVREKATILCSYARHRDDCQYGKLIIPQDAQGNYLTAQAYKGSCTCGFDALMNQILNL